MIIGFLAYTILVQNVSEPELNTMGQCAYIQFPVHAPNAALLVKKSMLINNILVNIDQYLVIPYFEMRRKGATMSDFNKYSEKYFVGLTQKQTDLLEKLFIMRIALKTI